ncbi:hypothetical protein pdam_00007383, partial [Pocillopora damicornis]
TKEVEKQKSTNTASPLVIVLAWGSKKDSAATASSILWLLHLHAAEYLNYLNLRRTTTRTMGSVVSHVETEAIIYRTFAKRLLLHWAQSSEYDILYPLIRVSLKAEPGCGTAYLVTFMQQHLYMILNLTYITKFSKFSAVSQDSQTMARLHKTSSSMTTLTGVPKGQCETDLIDRSRNGPKLHILVAAFTFAIVNTTTQYSIFWDKPTH